MADDFFQGTEIVYNDTTTKKFGFSSSVQKSIIANSPNGQSPWLVVTCGGSGALAAYETELIILKVGAISGLLAGATGGGRVTHFPYRQITTIEYNSGFAFGVLEVLTASYSGATNKDFWNIAPSNRGETDPHQQNNTLPLDKSTFKKITPHLNKIRELIEKTHRGNSPMPTGGISEELEKLSELHKKGILSDDEFAQAKKRVIG